MTRIVLAGSGYAHLFCVKHCADFQRRGCGLVLVAPSVAWYSGLASAALGGACPESLCRIDVAALCRRNGATLVAEEAQAIDRAASVLRTRAGTVGFDLLSLAVGSAPRPLPGEADGGDRCFSAKPIERLLAAGRALDRHCKAGRGVPRVVVAGGGLSGFEIAANLLARASRNGGRAALTLLAGREPLADLPSGARRAAMRALAAHGAELVADEAAAVENGAVVSGRGSRFRFSLFVNATGSVSHPLAATGWLDTDAEGRLLVDACLAAPSDRRIFGSGDCVAWNGQGLGRTGVHAVRQGPVLHRNLLAALDGEAPEPFKPQPRHLAIMNLGDRTALAACGGLWWRGRSALLLKNWIDQRFLRDYAG